MITKRTVTIIVALVIFWGGLPVIISFGSKTKESAGLSEQATAVGKPQGVTETDDGIEEEELDLDEETKATLERMRSFWRKQKVIEKRKVEFPSFRVPPRKEELEYFPCSDCHEDDRINIEKERKLTEEHQSVVLDHGGERFWCLTCHNLKNMDYFRSMKNEPIDFNKPYLLCGQCHAPRQKDWFFGGHGKRIGNWDGEKVALSCTECHDSHSPSIKPKPPEPPPKRHKGPDDFLTNLKKLGIWEQLGFKANDQSSR